MFYTNNPTIHIEITNRCNASCPMCPRNINGGKLHPDIKLTELTLSDIKQIFSKSYTEKLKRVLFCGNFGDPVANNDLLDIMYYFREQNPKLQLSINTNGSLKTNNWWKEVGKLLSQKGDSVKFSIDGLEDTNSLYRRNTNFNKIIENAKAYIESNGIAFWDYLVFKHNEHQIEEAKALSKKLGFKEFRLKRTSRFNDSLKFPVFDKNNNHEYDLELPTNKKYIHPAYNIKNNIKLEKYDQIADIECKVKHDDIYYMSAEGFVLPCCWMGYDLWKKESSLMNILELSGGIDTINAKLHPIEDIINGTFFNNIEKSWNNNCSFNRPLICSKTCSKNIDKFNEQFIKK